MPEITTDQMTPRGACRLASSVSSPNVPAVSNPYTMKIDMNMPSANVAQVVAVLVAASVPARSKRIAGRLVVGEEQQDQREHEHARGSRSPTPMLLRIDSSRTPNALISGRDDERRSGR